MKQRMMSLPPGEFSGLEDPEYNDERAQEALNRLKEKDPGKWKPVAPLPNEPATDQVEEM
jgi:hypothetical protein